MAIAELLTLVGLFLAGFVVVGILVKLCSAWITYREERDNQRWINEYLRERDAAKRMRKDKK